MPSRRGFVKELTSGVAAAVLPQVLLAAPVASRNISAHLPSFWDDVRNAFPLTRERTYFNNGTFGPSPTPVVDAMKSSMDTVYTSGDYGSIDNTRGHIAAFVKVKTEEISLTHNTTEGINIVAWGLPLKSGDEVIISRHEHVGNALPWLNRARLHGIVLKTFEPALTADGNLMIIRNMITSRTRVIAIPHITCTTGLVFPVKEIAALARSKNIFTAIDGAHGAGTLNLDLKTLGCDFYATSCHKWMLGPSGTGFLYVREALLDTLQTYWVGAHADTGWDMQVDPVVLKGYVPNAHRYDFGSQSTPLYTGVSEAINFLEAIGMGRIEERVRALSTHLQQQLLTLGSKIEMLTPQEPESRLSMISFRIQGMDFTEFNILAAKNKFRIRIVPESGLNALRISTHIYNSYEEIDRFFNLVKANV